MRPVLRPTLFAAVLSTLPCSIVATSAAHAQIVPEAVSCASCTIQMRAVAKIGTAEGAGSLPGRPGNVSQDSKGRFWLGALDYPMPLLYGADGRFVRELGRKGQGPGEYMRADVLAVLPGDSLLVADAGRGYVVTGPDYKAARFIRGNGLLQLGVVSWPKRVVAMQFSFAQNRNEQGIHVFDLSGDSARKLKTLVDMSPEPRVKDRAATAIAYAESQRIPGTPTADHVWVAQRHRYKLVRYGLDGSVQDSIIREPKWFKGLVPRSMGSETTLPSPMLTSVAEDAQGRLWVFLAQPLPAAMKAWKDAKVHWSKSGGGMEGRVSEMPAQYTLYKTIIEVIDPKTKRVITRKAVDGFVSDVLSANRVVTFVENEDWIPLATVWDLSLTGTK